MCDTLGGTFVHCILSAVGCQPHASPCNEHVLNVLHLSCSTSTHTCIQHGINQLPHTSSVRLHLDFLSFLCRSCMTHACFNLLHTFFRLCQVSLSAAILSTGLNWFPSPSTRMLIYMGTLKSDACVPDTETLHSAPACPWTRGKLIACRPAQHRLPVHMCRCHHVAGHAWQRAMICHVQP